MALHVPPVANETDAIAAFPAQSQDAFRALLHGLTPRQAALTPSASSLSIGGLVKPGSLKRDNLTVHFIVTDTVKDVPVAYTGILPDLFKEGKGAVVEGRLAPDGQFVASEVLAKHDENYMPPAAKDAVQQAKRAEAAQEASAQGAAKP